MRNERNEDDYQKWLEVARQWAARRKDRRASPNAPCIRISNDRYAKDATLEDRLSLEDMQLLKDMGIGL
jgi:hypothetical protein